MTVFSRWLLRGLGILLIAAAILKWHGFAVDPVRPTGWFAHPSVQMAIVLAELGIGVWFLTGVEAAAAWLCAVVMFSLFAVVSFRQGWIGEASCGCFGAVKVSPWVAFGADVCGITLLAITRPNLRELDTMRSRCLVLLNRGRASLVCFGLLFASLVSLSLVRFGSIDSSLAVLRGDTVTVQPRVVDIGVGQSGTAELTDVNVHNHSDTELFIYGGSSDCSCSVLGELPIRVPPRNRKSISVRVQFPQGSGQFSRYAILLTDAPAARTIAFRITGQTQDVRPQVIDGQ